MTRKVAAPISIEMRPHRELHRWLFLQHGLTLSRFWRLGVESADVLLTSSGHVLAFGSNSHGQLGVGDLVPRGAPTQASFS